MQTYRNAVPDDARSLARRVPLALTVGSVPGGMPIDGFDLGNSPAALCGINLSRRAVVLCTAGGVRSVAAFRPDLARSLHNLGIRLAALGRREEALAATREAADLYRALAAATPRMRGLRADRTLKRRYVFWHCNAQSSLLYAPTHCTGRGGFQTFLPWRSDAAGNMHRTYFLSALEHAGGTGGDAFRPDLARSLNVLGACFAALDRHDAALAAYEEAVRTLLPAFQRLPAAYADQMAYSVRDYGTACERLGRAPDAALLAEARQPE